jgi:hypothetical protein
MKTYTAGLQDKEKMWIKEGGTLVGTIDFDRSVWQGYIGATFTIGGETFKAESMRGNTIILKDGKELFTCVFHPLWGNLELQAAGQDTGFDIKGKWFKPGTRLTDADDNDLVVVTADALTGSKITVEVADDVPPVMVAMTLYHHVRASAAKLMVTIIT